MKIGLTSVTFRSKSVCEVAKAASEAGISAIEWGGDVHCPPNDSGKQREALAVSNRLGIACVSYGSYFRLGVSETGEFEDICRTALFLGAKIVRIWAFNKSPDETPEKDYSNCIAQAKEISLTAEKYSVTVCFEYHRGTLTQNAGAALKLIGDIGCENMRLYWQPNPDIAFEENCRELKAVLKYVVNIHCFCWKNEGGEKNKRFLLECGRREWCEYLDIAAGGGNVRYVLLEFVKDDSDEAFFADADTLKDLLCRYSVG